MIDKILTWFRDWKRGYSADDIWSASEKMSSAPQTPGTIIWLTDRESRALRDNNLVKRS